MSWAFRSYRTRPTSVPRRFHRQGEEDSRVCLLQLWQAEDRHGEYLLPDAADLSVILLFKTLFAALSLNIVLKPSGQLLDQK